ncbi:MAG: cation:proton antiporter [Candidatus Diapherotrites archaeon]
MVEASLEFLLVVLVASLAGRLACKKFDQPLVLGELLAGLILGNLFFSVVLQPIALISQIGVIILLFSSGLALDFEEVKRLGRQSLVITTAGALLPFFLGYGFALLMGFSQFEALFAGTALIATSIGINAEILSEKEMLRTRMGTTIMGAAVIDDIYGIIALAVLGGIVKSGEVHLSETVFLVIASLLLFAFSLSIVMKAFQRLAKRFSFRPENLLLLGVIVALCYSLVAKEIGLELVVGAFLGGLVLGQSRYSKDLLESVSVFGESFFIPVFFVTAGMALQLETLFSHAMLAFTIGLIILAFIGKTAGCGLAALYSGFSKNESLAIGIAMTPRAEVALVIASIGASYGLGLEIVAAITAMVFVTTLAVPPLLAIQLKKVKREMETHLKKSDFKNGGRKK